MYRVTTEEWYDYVLCIKGSENKLSENVFWYTKTNFTKYLYDLINLNMHTACQCTNVRSVVTFTPYTSKQFQ
jgi:hypothetical protein